MPVTRRLALTAVLVLTLAACGPAATTPAAAPTADASPATAVVDEPAAEDRAGPSPSEEEPTDVHEGHAMTPTDPSPPDAADHVEVVMVDVAFAPDHIEIPAATPVALSVRNDGVIEHDLDLPEAGLHVHALPGEQQTATLQIDEPGSYEAQCLIPGHAEAGMLLQVTVR